MVEKSCTHINCCGVHRLMASMDCTSLQQFVLDMHMSVIDVRLKPGLVRIHHF